MSYIECNFIDRESEEEVRENTVKQGFSLMEMMVVLLIMSIIAAATAPIVSKKMMASKSVTSPWVFTGEGKNIAYNMGGLSNAVAIIGAAKVPSGTKTRLYIDCGDDTAQIALGKGDTAASILADPVGKRVGIYSASSSVSVPSSSVAIGMGQSLSGSFITAIGASASVTGSNSVALGANSKAGSNSAALGYSNTSTGANSLATGSNSTATASGAVAVGGYADATQDCAISMGYFSEASGTRSVAIGSSATASLSDTVALGSYTQATGDNSIAIGGGSSTSTAAKATSICAVAIGGYAKAEYRYSTSIGYSSSSSNIYSTANGYYAMAGNHATAVGAGATASGYQSTAIGRNATASHQSSTAIGYNARTKGDRQIVLGDTTTTVYIPGHLIVDKYAAFGAGSTSYPTYLRGERQGARMFRFIGGDDNKGGDCDSCSVDTIPFNTSTKVYKSNSDRRLKNVGKNYIAGLNELKKLDFYHYTFKNDDKKIPRVGVMAQDLQKVFPDAVTKGEDGYLRIRFEDMFFAVINAIKELDEKISNIITKNDEQDKTISAQQELIEAQQKTIEKLEKRITELEKKS